MIPAEAFLLSAVVGRFLYLKSLLLMKAYFNFFK